MHLNMLLMLRLLPVFLSSSFFMVPSIRVGNILAEKVPYVVADALFLLNLKEFTYKR